MTWRKWWRREGIHWYWTYWTKPWSLNEENTIDFRWSDVQEEFEEDIALVNLIESLQKHTDDENFPKK